MELEVGVRLTRNAGDLTFDSTETEAVFLLAAHLPGFTKDEIEVATNEGEKHISIRGGGHVACQEAVIISRVAITREVSVECFDESFPVPDGVDWDGIEAWFDEEEKILIISIPKLLTNECSWIREKETAEHPIQEERVETEEPTEEEKNGDSELKGLMRPYKGKEKLKETSGDSIRPSPAEQLQPGTAGAERPDQVLETDLIESKKEYKDIEIEENREIKREEPQVKTADEVLEAQLIESEKEGIELPQKERDEEIHERPMATEWLEIRKSEIEVEETNEKGPQLMGSEIERRASIETREGYQDVPQKEEKIKQCQEKPTEKPSLLIKEVAEQRKSEEQAEKGMHQSEEEGPQENKNLTEGLSHGKPKTEKLSEPIEPHQRDGKSQLEITDQVMEAKHPTKSQEKEEEMHKQEQEQKELEQRLHWFKEDEDHQLKGTDVEPFRARESLKTKELSMDLHKQKIEKPTLKAAKEMREAAEPTKTEKEGKVEPQLQQPEKQEINERITPTEGLSHEKTRTTKVQVPKEPNKKLKQYEHEVQEVEKPIEVPGCEMPKAVELAQKEEPKPRAHELHEDEDHQGMDPDKEAFKTRMSLKLEEKYKTFQQEEEVMKQLPHEKVSDKKPSEPNEKVEINETDQILDAEQFQSEDIREELQEHDNGMKKYDEFIKVPTFEKLETAGLKQHEQEVQEHEKPIIVPICERPPVTTPDQVLEDKENSQPEQLEKEFQQQEEELQKQEKPTIVATWDKPKAAEYARKEESKPWISKFQEDKNHQRKGPDVDTSATKKWHKLDEESQLFQQEQEIMKQEAEKLTMREHKRLIEAIEPKKSEEEKEVEEELDQPKEKELQRGKMGRVTTHEVKQEFQISADGHDDEIIGESRKPEKQEEPLPKESTTLQKELKSMQEQIKSKEHQKPTVETPRQTPDIIEFRAVEKPIAGPPFKAPKIKEFISLEEQEQKFQSQKREYETESPDPHQSKEQQREMQSVAPAYIQEKEKEIQELGDEESFKREAILKSPAKFPNLIQPKKEVQTLKLVIQMEESMIPKQKLLKPEEEEMQTHQDFSILKKPETKAVIETQESEQNQESKYQKPAEEPSYQAPKIPKLMRLEEQESQEKESPVQWRLEPGKSKDKEEQREQLSKKPTKQEATKLLVSEEEKDKIPIAEILEIKGMPESQEPYEKPEKSLSVEAKMQLKPTQEVEVEENVCPALKVELPDKQELETSKRESQTKGVKKVTEYSIPQEQLPKSKQPKELEGLGLRIFMEKEAKEQPEQQKKPHVNGPDQLLETELMESKKEYKDIQTEEHIRIKYEKPEVKTSNEVQEAELIDTEKEEKELPNEQEEEKLKRGIAYKKPIVAEWPEIKKLGIELLGNKEDEVPKLTDPGIEAIEKRAVIQTKKRSEDVHLKEEKMKKCHEKPTEKPSQLIKEETEQQKSKEKAHKEKHQPKEEWSKECQNHTKELTHEKSKTEKFPGPKERHQKDGKPQLETPDQVMEVKHLIKSKETEEEKPKPEHEHKKLATVQIYEKSKATKLPELKQWLHGFKEDEDCQLTDPNIEANRTRESLKRNELSLHLPKLETEKTTLKQPKEMLEVTEPIKTEKEEKEVEPDQHQPEEKETKDQKMQIGLPHEKARTMKLQETKKSGQKQDMTPDSELERVLEAAQHIQSKLDEKLKQYEHGMQTDKEPIVAPVWEKPKAAELPQKEEPKPHFHEFHEDEYRQCIGPDREIYEARMSLELEKKYEDFQQKEEEMKKEAEKPEEKAHKKLLKVAESTKLGGKDAKKEEQQLDEQEIQEYKKPIIQPQHEEASAMKLPKPKGTVLKDKEHIQPELFKKEFQQYEQEEQKQIKPTVVPECEKPKADMETSPTKKSLELEEESQLYQQEQEIMKQKVEMQTKEAQKQFGKDAEPTQPEEKGKVAEKELDQPIEQESQKRKTQGMPTYKLKVEQEIQISAAEGHDHKITEESQEPKKQDKLQPKEATTLEKESKPMLKHIESKEHQKPAVEVPYQTLDMIEFKAPEELGRMTPKVPDTKEVPERQERYQQKESKEFEKPAANKIKESRSLKEQEQELQAQQKEEDETKTHEPHQSKEKEERLKELQSVMPTYNKEIEMEIQQLKSPEPFPKVIKPEKEAKKSMLVKEMEESMIPKQKSIQLEEKEAPTPQGFYVLKEPEIEGMLETHQPEHNQESKHQKPAEKTPYKVSEITRFKGAEEQELQEKEASVHKGPKPRKTKEKEEQQREQVNRKPIQQEETILLNSEAEKEKIPVAKTLEIKGIVESHEPYKMTEETLHVEAELQLKLPIEMEAQERLRPAVGAQLAVRISERESQTKDVQHTTESSMPLIQPLESKQPKELEGPRSRHFTEEVSKEKPEQLNQPDEEEVHKSESPMQELARNGAILEPLDSAERTNALVETVIEPELYVSEEGEVAQDIESPTLQKPQPFPSKHEDIKVLEHDDNRVEPPKSLPRIRVMMETERLPHQQTNEKEATEPTISPPTIRVAMEPEGSPLQPSPYDEAIKREFPALIQKELHPYSDITVQIPEKQVTASRQMPEFEQVAAEQEGKTKEPPAPHIAKEAIERPSEEVPHKIIEVPQQEENPPSPLDHEKKTVEEVSGDEAETSGADMDKTTKVKKLSTRSHFHCHCQGRRTAFPIPPSTLLSGSAFVFSIIVLVFHFNKRKKSN